MLFKDPLPLKGFLSIGGLLEVDMRESCGMVNEDGHGLVPVMGWTASHLSNQSCNICFQLVYRHNFTRSGGNKSI